MPYSKRLCGGCSIEFQPTTSRNKFCCARCRFMVLMIPFKGIDGCWEWPKSINKQTGYGQFMVTSKPMVLETAHRLSYIFCHGELPKGQFVCHHCDNRRCFNPAHLFIGSPADNISDMIRKGRQQKYVDQPKGKDHHLVKNPELSPTRKLSEQQVREIFHADGKHREIADAYGVFSATIADIKSRRSWRHLDFGTSRGSDAKTDIIQTMAGK